jgi:hypothetical protein
MTTEHTNHPAAPPAPPPLANEPRILDCFASALHKRGLAGEERTAKLLYLVVTTRWLDRPVSSVVKGPSSAGKSHVVQSVLDFFPASAYYALSGMSERALVYSREPLAHRFLVIYEAAGLQGDFAAYLVRSLLSEGHLRYVTVEKTRDGLRERTIEREGPTGLLLTTTAIALHPENETRVFSIPVTDTVEQTRAVLLELARQDHDRPLVDLRPWHDLQAWLEAAEHRVLIPFAERLASLIPPVSVRLRRDFGAILSLIRAHTLLHQATRARSKDGWVIATIEDYRVVRDLVFDLVSDGVEASVSPVVRETVVAVRKLNGVGHTYVSLPILAAELGLDKGSVSRRVQAAVSANLLTNFESRRGLPAMIALGDPLPQDVHVLPLPEGLED